MAETGATGTLLREFDAAGKQVGKTFVGPPISTGAGVAKTTVKVTPFKRFISATSMMAPSPDWFAGVRANMCNGKTGEWRKTVVKSGRLYDAGTDSGVTFFSDNKATNPAGVVKKITEKTGDMRYPFYNPGTDMPDLFEFTFTLEN